MACSVPKRARAGGDHAVAALPVHEPPVGDKVTRPPMAGGWLHPSQVPAVPETTGLAGAASLRLGQVRQLRPSGASSGATLRSARPSAVPTRLVQDVLRTPGQPLSAPLREEMEACFGTSFSDVRVHADADARPGLICAGTPARRCGAIRRCQLTASGTRVRAGQAGMLPPAARPEK